MKIKLVLTLLMLAQQLCAQAADSAALAKELIRSKQEIRDLSKQVQYYKNVLNSSKAIRTNTFEDISFELNQITGSRKDGSVIIGFYYKNLQEPRKILQCERAIMVDMEGNQHQTTQIFLAPNGKVIAKDLVKNVPYRGGIFYKKINSYFPVIRALVLYVYPEDNFSNPVPVVFENVPIVWD